MSRFPLAIAAAISLILPHLADAQEAAPEQPMLSTATYRDWTLRCASIGPDGKACEIAQGLALPGNNQPVGRAAIGRLSSAEPLRLVVQLPLGVWLPGGVQVAPVGENALNATFTSCRRLCDASVDLDDAFIAVLEQAEQPLTITFQDGAQQPVSLSLSTNGVTAALSAMRTATGQE